MSSSPSTPNFSPDLFFTTVNAYYQTAAVKAAIQLDLLNAISEQGSTLAEIAAACSATRRGTRILCRYLASIGFLKTAGDLFFLTKEMGLYLRKDSPRYLGRSIDFLLSREIMDAFTDLAGVVRTGRVALNAETEASSRHPRWAEFARAMAPIMALPAFLTAEVADPLATQPLKVLDVAAGHGLFGIAIARRNPAATVTLIDWSDVLEAAREKAEKAGIIESIAFLAGDAFSVDFGAELDVIIIANFLHHFDSGACEQILAKAHAALRDGGRALIVEFIMNEDRMSPPLAAEFSMMMLATTAGGEAWAYSDLEHMLSSSGFDRIELRAIPPAREGVVVATKNIARR
jgi:ubiquinone/menaquinone biosynthesis C-methylase UbiE